MKTYISSKLYKAEPETRDGQPGYKVVYPDGYMSWCPAEAFENASRELTEPELSVFNDAASLGISGVRIMAAVVLLNPFEPDTPIVRFPMGENGFFGASFPGGHVRGITRPVAIHELQLVRQSAEEEKVSLITDEGQESPAKKDPAKCKHKRTAYDIANDETTCLDCAASS